MKSSFHLLAIHWSAHHIAIITPLATNIRNATATVIFTNTFIIPHISHQKSLVASLGSKQRSPSSTTHGTLVLSSISYFSHSADTAIENPKKTVAPTSKP